MSGSRNPKSSDKGKGVAQSSKPPPPKRPRSSNPTKSDATFDPFRFKTRADLDLWNAGIRDRAILLGIPVRFDDFQDEGFSLSLFRRLGWTDVLSISCRIYPEAVRLFYAHVAEYEDGAYIESYVLGTKIKLTEQLLGQILCIPCEGSPLGTGFQIPPLATGTLADFLESIRLDRTSTPSPKDKELTPSYRLFHKILARSILPKGGNFDNVTREHLSLMYRLMHHIPTNLPRIIMDHMVEAPAHHRLSLPYGMWLTPIFEHFGVPLDTVVSEPPPAWLRPPPLTMVRETRSKSVHDSSTAAPAAITAASVDALTNAVNGLRCDFMRESRGLRTMILDNRYGIQTLFRGLKNEFLEQSE